MDGSWGNPTVRSNDTKRQVYTDHPARNADNVVHNVVSVRWDGDGAITYWVDIGTGEWLTILLSPHDAAASAPAPTMHSLG
eukprot:COSAG01_NODE_3161_length_6481_cov_89.230962_5_plen_81_part_00